MPEIKKIKTGVLGGTFDPVHFGHIQLGKYLTDNKYIDECWYIVSPHNPLKNASDISDEKTRFKQVEKALENYPKSKACNIEFSLPKPSYTANTLRILKEEYPEREFILIIGGDNLDIFTKWKEHDYILNNFKIIVYPRNTATNIIPKNWKNVTLIKNAPLFKISSTEIREERKNQE